VICTTPANIFQKDTQGQSMKNNFYKCNLYIFVFVFLTSACQVFGKRGGEIEKNTQMLSTQRWQLTKLHSSDIELPKLANIPFISFVASTKKVEGFAGCNSFFGRYNQKNQTLTISALGMTRRYCAETSALEFKYENMLGKVTNFKIMKQSLVLFDDNKELATFKAIE